MTFYNMLFGMNPYSDLLLALVGLRRHEVERFRDAGLCDDGTAVAIYTRTGGGNREEWPQARLTESPLYLRDEDDEFDCTYATFYLGIPEEFRSDLNSLANPLMHGLRPEFGQHLAKTLQREPTQGDLDAAAYEEEEQALRATKHEMANGHTFVPHNDAAMEVALKLAEANSGELRSGWGILPLVLTVVRDNIRFPNAKGNLGQSLDRVRVDYEWKVDESYWQHCEERWRDAYPLAMAEISAGVEALRGNP